MALYMNTRLTQIHSSLRQVINNDGIYLAKAAGGPPDFNQTTKKQLPASEVFKVAQNAIIEAAAYQSVSNETVEILTKDGQDLYNKYLRKTNRPWRMLCSVVCSIACFLFPPLFSSNPFTSAKMRTEKAYNEYIKRVRNLNSPTRKLGLEILETAKTGAKDIVKLVQNSEPVTHLRDVNSALSFARQGKFKFAAVTLVSPLTSACRHLFMYACKQSMPPHVYDTAKTVAYLQQHGIV